MKRPRLPMHVRVPLQEVMALHLPRSARIASAVVTPRGKLTLSFTTGSGQRRSERRVLTYLPWRAAVASDDPRIRILARTRIPSAEGCYAICEVSCPVASERRVGDLVQFGPRHDLRRPRSIQRA